MEKLEERIEQTHLLIRQNEKRINKLDTRIVKLDTLIESIDKTLIRLQEGQKELRNHADDKFDKIAQHYFREIEYGIFCKSILGLQEAFEYRFGEKREVCYSEPRQYACG